MAEIWEKNIDYPQGVKPLTRATIPAANIIVVGGKWIGYIQNIDETQDRPVTEQYEVGSIGPVEILPGQPKYSFTMNKVKVYKKRMLQIFMENGYAEKFGPGYVGSAIEGQMAGNPEDTSQELFSLIIHNILPFDVEVWELNYGVDAEGNPMDWNFAEASKSKVKTKYIGCWISNYSKPINHTNANIVETMNVSARRIGMGI
jgi:hypothetical protein